jgi:hypothetical protein
MARLTAGEKAVYTTGVVGVENRLVVGVESG